MTPAARLSAAIEVIETIEAARIPAGQALKEWGTAHRFAGSADRPAEFAVRRGPQQLCAGRSLAEALEFFRPRLILLAAGPG